MMYYTSNALFVIRKRFIAQIRRFRTKMRLIMTPRKISLFSIAATCCLLTVGCNSRKHEDKTHNLSLYPNKLTDSIKFPIYQSLNKYNRGFQNFDHSIGRFPENTRKILFGYDKSTLFRVDTLCPHEFEALVERLKTQMVDNKNFNQDDDYAFLQVYNTRNNHSADYQYEGFREENPRRDTMNLYFKKRQVFYSEVVDDEYLKLEEGYIRKIKNKYHSVAYHRNTVFYPSLNILSNFMFCNNCSSFYIDFDCGEMN